MGLLGLPGVVQAPAPQFEAVRHLIEEGLGNDHSEGPALSAAVLSRTIR